MSYPPGYAAPTPDGAPHAGPNVGGQVGQWPPSQHGDSTDGPRSRVALVWAGVAFAVILGVASLVLSIFAAVRSHESSSPPTVAQAEPQRLFVDDVDRQLCQAIAPLMRESTDTKNAYIRSGPPGSPERDAAISKFKSDTERWADRTQELINGHANPPRYLTRTLQRYVDDMLLYVENIYPGQAPDEFDQPTWQLGIVDYGGPLGACARLGVEW